MRYAAAAVAMTLTTAVAAPSAMAHNGIGAFYKAKVGDYIVYAYDADPLDDGMLDYKLVLLKGATKNPVYDVTSKVSAAHGGAAPAATGVPDSATGEVTTFGNVVYYRLPNPYPGYWKVSLGLDGPLGNAATSFRAHGVPPADSGPIVISDDNGGFPWAAVAGVVGGALLVALLVVMLRRRT